MNAQGKRKGRTVKSLVLTVPQDRNHRGLRCLGRPAGRNEKRLSPECGIISYSNGCVHVGNVQDAIAISDRQGQELLQPRHGTGFFQIAAPARPPSTAAIQPAGQPGVASAQRCKGSERCDLEPARTLRFIFEAAPELLAPHRPPLPPRARDRDEDCEPCLQIHACKGMETSRGLFSSGSRGGIGAGGTAWIEGELHHAGVGCLPRGEWGMAAGQGRYEADTAQGSAAERLIERCF
jgi:hypothetical protein